MVELKALPTLCPCGQPLHYASDEARKEVEAVIRRKGPFMLLTVDEGVYRVPRHYVALHQPARSDVARLATDYGWERVDTTQGPDLRL